VIGKRLPDTSLRVRLLLERAQALQRQIAHRLRRFELQRRHPMRGKDTQAHLHALFYLLDASEALIHPCPHPCWDWLALLLIALTLG
jgi:hypothetical protein